MKCKRGGTLSLDESAVVFLWVELCPNLKNTSYLFTVHYLILMYTLPLV